MKKFLILTFIILFTASFAQGAERPPKESPLEKMSREDQIKLARSAAPSFVSKDAAVMLPGPDNKLTEAVKGTNGFTCIPDIDGQEAPDPVCADEAAMAFLGDMMAKRDKPSNTMPGVAYMARGGWHWEKDGRVIMDRTTAGAKRVKEPTHWMITWPLESKKTGLPVKSGRFGTYIMFDGTPFAHLMIHQDPSRIRE